VRSPLGAAYVDVHKAQRSGSTPSLVARKLRGLAIDPASLTVMDTRLLGPAALALVMSQRCPFRPGPWGTVRDRCAAVPTKRKERFVYD
jgi:hypothetical protein